MIADDDPIILLDLKQTLESLDYQVVGEATDGQKALELARLLKPDVCIFDVKMPKMDGIEAAEVVTDEGIAPVLLLTAFSDKELIDRAKEAGVYGYLIKPFQPSDLLPAIEVARSRFEENRQLEAEVTTLQEKLEARKLIDRAKGILMAETGITEVEAYRRIQLQSMNTRKTMKEVAEAIILAKEVQKDPSSSHR